MGSVNASNLWLFDTQFDTRKAITDNPSYTNQPYFTPDSLSLYYTQAIPMTPNIASDADTIAESQMDIYRYSLTEHQHTLLISSATSEYSPTPMPDGSGISTILVDSEISNGYGHIPNKELVLKNLSPKNRLATMLG